MTRRLAGDNMARRLCDAFAAIVASDPLRRHPVLAVATAILPSCASPEGAYNECHPVSMLLVSCLPAAWEPRLVQFIGWKGPLLGAFAAKGDRNGPPETWLHFAVATKPSGPRGGLWALDATARQFDEHLPWPHVWPLVAWRTWWREARLQPTPRGAPGERSWRRLPRTQEQYLRECRTAAISAPLLRPDHQPQ